MYRIAPIRLMYSPRTLWFDAGELELTANTHVVVSTARGTEFGTIVEAVFEATDEQVEALKAPLKPVLREATAEDEAAAAEMERLSREALPIFREYAAEDNAEMHPISVEYLLDGDKAVFYFEAEDRIDFRDLVRRLAARFHVRVDMRQIGIRDEARMVGGIAHCGQELCCKRLGGEFCPVSIKMAKEQDLSLNPQKISGLCGRLMCCLRYEYEAYRDFRSRAPKEGAVIMTPDGPGKVVELNVPREVLTLQMEDEKRVKVKLAEMDEPTEQGARPQSIGKEAWEQVLGRMGVGTSIESLFLTSQFTEDSKLGEAKAVRRQTEDERAQRESRRAGQKGVGSIKPTGSADFASSRSSRKSGAGAGVGSGAGASSASSPQELYKHRRRSTQVDLSGTDSVSYTPSTPGAGSAAAPSTQAVRPGQKSSGLRRTIQAITSPAKEQAARGGHKNQNGQPAHGASRANDARVANTRGADTRGGDTRQAASRTNEARMGARSSVQQSSAAQRGAAHAQETNNRAQRNAGKNAEPQHQTRREPRRRTQIDSDSHIS